MSAMSAPQSAVELAAVVAQLLDRKQGKQQEVNDLAQMIATQRFLLRQAMNREGITSLPVGDVMCEIVTTEHWVITDRDRLLDELTVRGKYADCERVVFSDGMAVVKAVELGIAGVVMKMPETSLVVRALTTQERIIRDRSAVQHSFMSSEVPDLDHVPF